MTDIDTILLDRDGTLIEERHYLSDPALVALIPGAAPPMRRLIELGCGFYLASNQSGIGRGFFDADDYRRVHARLPDAAARADDTRRQGAALLVPFQNELRDAHQILPLPAAVTGGGASVCRLR